MPTFTLRRADGTTEETEFTPMTVNFPGGLIRFALHRDECMAWVLSDPTSGRRVLTVRGSYKGIRVSTRDMNMTEARQEARKQLLALVEAVGLPKFRTALAGAAAALPAPVAAPQAALAIKNASTS